MFFDDYKVENNGLYILWEGDSEYDYEGAIKWHGENMLLRRGEEGDDWYFFCATIIKEFLKIDFIIAT